MAVFRKGKEETPPAAKLSGTGRAFRHLCARRPAPPTLWESLRRQRRRAMTTAGLRLS
jgi:hypothetical protein